MIEKLPLNFPSPLLTSTHKRECRGQSLCRGFGASPEIPLFFLRSRRSHIPSRSFRITEAGRKRLHELMLDTTSYLGEYQKVFLQKVACFSFLQPEERLHLIEHYRGYCQSLVSYGTARMEELAQSGTKSPVGMTSVQLADLLIGMQHKVYQWQQELLWAEELREQVKARIGTPPTPPGGALS